MNLKQARQRLTKLGFAMGTEPIVPNWGSRTLTEAFDFHPHHLLSKPYRDVYIGKAKGGWTISSHIHFRGRLYRHRKWNTSWMDRRNIFGMGNTLAQAVSHFKSLFQANEKLHLRLTK